MAHKVRLILNCDTDGCPRMADFEVYDNFNNLYGKYCKKCAEEKIKTINKYQDLQAKEKTI